MSNLLSQASLVMIPSGYKEDIVYSQIPTDGSGDLSFTRASNGTRINSAGLVENCPWNLLQYSEDFTNAAWTKNNSVSSAPVVTANDTTAPNETMTADKIVFSNGVGGAINGVYQYFTTLKGARTASVWLKSASGTPTIYITTQDDAAGGNFTTCVLSTEWKRFEVTFTTNSTSLQSLLIGYYPASGTPSGPSGSLTVYAWGAMVNIGSTAKPYFPTTNRQDVPRLTYQNGGGGCPSLLLEPQRTNLVNYSEQFDNAIWSKVELSVSANLTTSPDGTQNADKLIPTTANSFHYTETSSASVSNNALASVFAKKSGYQRFAIRSYFTGNYAIFDVNSGVVVLTNGTTATIENYGNGWFRCSLNDTGSASYGFQIFVMQNTSTNPTDSYSGNGTDGMYIWGAQLEAGAYPTSYIPTTSASVTRLADACFKTGISSLIGQTQGTMFMEIDNSNPSIYLGTAPNNTIFGSINSGDYLNNFHFNTDTTKLYLYCNASGGALQAAIGITMPTTPKIKMAVTYTSTAIKFFVNGSLVGTDTSFTLPSSMSRVDVGHMGGQPDSQRMRGGVNQFILSTSAFTDAQAIALTTL